VVEAIKDCGSGLNDTRKGFLKLLEVVTSGRVQRVIVENKDRLTRFGYETLVYLFRQNGVEIEVTQAQPKTEYDELAQDLMMLIASFSGKLYRRRALARKKEQETT
jgi:putative resolvase